MGQQLNKIVKRRRRKLYLARKKALAKVGVSRKARAAAKSAEVKTAKKTPAKKPAAKKAAAKPKAAEAEVVTAVATEATVQE